MILPAMAIVPGPKTTYQTKLSRSFKAQVVWEAGSLPSELHGAGVIFEIKKQPPLPHEEDRCCAKVAAECLISLL